MRIQLLASSVANQIAAGEVIERPASVVKELLENALDAGATSVSIEIGFGGLNLIKVHDNGVGICEDDLHLAIAAHATSKITQVTDLYHITTMGFRGEALASIASVSRMSLYSKPLDQQHGMMLAVDETGVALRPCARTQGTTVEVRDLFFNTPVRKTFLKTERLEYQAIELVVKQFALSAPAVALTLKHNGKLMLTLPAVICEASRIRRVKKLFGQAFLEDAVYLDVQHEDLCLQGWMTQRTYQRSQRDRQWVYLNGRLIKDKLIQQAIGQAYQGILHPGRYASCLLYLAIAPEQVDVNVHPTKHEVRFRQPRLVHSMLVSVVSEQLQQPELQLLSHKSDLSQIPLPVGSQQQAHPERPSAVHDLVASSPWVAVNPQFVVLRGPNAAAYLVHMLGVYQCHLADLLQTHVFPYASRPLLVPVRWEIDRAHYALFERYQPMLQQLGIAFDFMAETMLLIRSIPLCLPLLNLDQFLLVIQRGELEQPALIKQAIACQSFDAYYLSAVEQEMLVDYFFQHWTGPHLQGCWVDLDVDHCQQILQGTTVYG